MVAESFAAIVGLLVQFKSERGEQAKLEYQEFMEWLANAHHEETKNLLELNTQATIYIKALLNEDHRVFKEKLEKIDTALAAFSSAIDGFDGLAKTIKPNSQLSAQAISVLKQVDASGASKFLEVSFLEGDKYLFLDAEGGLLIEDSRFIADDLRILVENGLLMKGYNSRGETMYSYTRAAKELIN